ncbi:formate dehydrogenase subunit gamma [Nitrincola nitratireducens]|uniref:Formate dehydrogenase-N subunit gamma n=1 Tax=Nitrincola nitratireducens TaxID=1229521 RepID=W9V168_9GAMM|nr:formate dehydrogenase subunit gamma [Nitrincola nitratireducens]EXJ09857.1 Formate dehydrogenase-N subunit gamma [Nitrincola nitratireducens]
MEKSRSRTSVRFWLVMLLVGCLFSLPVVAQSQGADARREALQSMPGTTPDFWRDAAGGVSGRTTSRSVGADTLIMTEGERWKEIRNEWISPGGLLALGGSLTAITFFYLLVGRVKLTHPRTGKTIERWTRWDRAIHWYVATLFIILALTGLSILYAKWFLMPILPTSLWSAWMIAAKNIHNYLGPLFSLGVLVMIVKWIKHNFFNLVDLKWFIKGGGIVGKGHPSAGYLNGGEKVWFWMIVFVGLTVVASGLVLDFPNFGQTRETMQLFLIIHAVSSLVLMAAAFGHIYIGTLGTEGAFEGMKTGYVDESWAKQHHDLWYEEVKQKQNKS